MADIYRTMRMYLDRIVLNDFQGAAAFFADDIVAHVSGHSPLSGRYEGKQAFAGYLTRAVGMLDSIRTEEHDLLVSDDHAVVLAKSHLERGDKSVTSNRVVVYHLDDDKITEIWLVDEDQAAVDEIFS